MSGRVSAPAGWPSDAPTDIFAAPPLPIARLDDGQRLACLRLIRSENVGPATFRALINHYGGAQAALDALPELSRRAGRGRPIRICGVAHAEAEIEATRRAGARMVFTIEPGYPTALAFLEGAPPMLYIKGRADLLNKRIISIVGSRQSSAGGNNWRGSSPRRSARRAMSSAPGWRAASTRCRIKRRCRPARSR